MTKNMREVCLLDGNSLIQTLSSPLNLQTSDFWCTLLGTVGMKLGGRRYSFKDKVLALSLLKRGPKSYKSLHSLFPLPSR